MMKMKKKKKKKKKIRCIGEITPFSECLSIAQDDISKDQIRINVQKDLASDAFLLIQPSNPNIPFEISLLRRLNPFSSKVGVLHHQAVWDTQPAWMD